MYFRPAQLHHLACSFAVIRPFWELKDVSVCSNCCRRLFWVVWFRVKNWRTVMMECDEYSLVPWNNSLQYLTLDAVLLIAFIVDCLSCFPACLSHCYFLPFAFASKSSFYFRQCYISLDFSGNWLMTRELDRFEDPTQNYIVAYVFWLSRELSYITKHDVLFRL